MAPQASIVQPGSISVRWLERCSHGVVPSAAWRRRRPRACATASIVVLVLGGCTPGRTLDSTDLSADPVAGATLAWPKPPDAARITYVASIEGPEDLRLRRSFFERLGEILTARSSERFVRPTGVAVRGALMAVADPGSRSVFLFDLDKRRHDVLTRAGDEELESPVAVAIGAAGETYVADSSAGSVHVYDSARRLRASWGAGELLRPTGLALDESESRLFVVDAADHRVVVYDSNGTSLRSFGGRGSAPGEFNFPSQIWIDEDTGEVYVVDTLNFRVQIFDRNGTFLSDFGRVGNGSGELSRPKGIAVDREGHVYLVDALFDTVQIFDRGGVYLLAFGDRGTGRGELWLPTGLTIDAQRRIYVADSYNGRVQVFQRVGESRVQ